MLGRTFTPWFWYGPDRSGFCLGTCLWTLVILLLYAAGIEASLSVGPGGEFPRFRDVFLYALSHEDLSSLSVSVALLLLLGPCQERCWGTVAFLSLSILTMIILPLLYALLLFVGSAEASRFCGYSAIQLALFTAHCRQVTQRRVLRCLPLWFLPWGVLLTGLLLLPGTPAFLHFCAICIGHNYRQPFVATLQELEDIRVLEFIPKWAYVSSSGRFRLPTFTSPQRSGAHSEVMPVDLAAATLRRDRLSLGHPTWHEPSPAWMMQGSAVVSDAEVLEEEMLRAGIIASLQDTPENPDAKVEVSKSSVSSLRLQQLEKMGFPTEKAVVALAASKQLDGAISLLIDDRIGAEAVVVSKGKNSVTQ